MKIFVLLFCFTFIASAQQEQAGRDLAASFPAVTPGAIEPDLPEDGFYWNREDRGFGMSIEIQRRSSSPTGFFAFGSGYMYDQDGNQAWCAFSDVFEPNPNVFEWRDKKSFSNMPWGHNRDVTVAELSVDCLRFEGGAPFGQGSNAGKTILEAIPLRIRWETPTKAQVFVRNEQPFMLERFPFNNDLQNPTLDWVTESEWLITSSVATYVNDSNEDETTLKFVDDFNMVTNFEILDVTEQQQLKDFVGHQSNFNYYISSVRLSIKKVDYYNFENPFVDIYAPYVFGNSSNNYWAVLVQNPNNNTVRLFTVAGEKSPGELRPDAGIGVKFIANIDPDADVFDFYPYRCESDYFRCTRTYRPERNSDTANFSEQNIHRSTMKMFKLRTGGSAYIHQPNKGESDASATNRIREQIKQ